MNYLSALLAFDNWQPDNLHDTSAIALWYALMRVANNCGWLDWFTVPIKTLEVKSGLGRSAVYAARNRLCQVGRLEVRERAGQQCAKYRLCPFEGHNPAHNPAHNPEHNPGLLTKPKYKPKPKDTTTTPAHPREDYGDEAAQAYRMELDAVKQAAEGIGLPMESRDEQAVELLHADYGAEWLLEAIRRTADRAKDKRSWGYIRGILRNWRTQGGIDDADRPDGQNSRASPGGAVRGSGKYDALAGDIVQL